MAAPVLNYTTEVPVERTVGEVCKILVAHGAASVTVEYAKGRPVAVSFAMDSRHGRDAYLLPARTDRVHSRLKARLKAREIPPRYATPEQAERVAWRTCKDWIEAQLAMVANDLVDLDEVLLPYQLRNGKTFFDWYVETRKSLPGPEGPGASRG